jgi:hypothetical protein
MEIVNVLVVLLVKQHHLHHVAVQFLLHGIPHCLTPGNCIGGNSNNWQCSVVSTSYNFVECGDNGMCECKTSFGFVGDATLASPCNCPSGKSVVYFNGNAYCLSPGQVIVNILIISIRKNAFDY